jgi:hypothetical protein
VDDPNRTYGYVSVQSSRSTGTQTIPAMSGQVERHTQSLLSGSEVTLVERIGLLSSARERSACRARELLERPSAKLPKACVLTDGPRLVDIHGGIRAAGVGELSWDFVRDLGRIVLQVQRLERKALQIKLKPTSKVFSGDLIKSMALPQAGSR